MPEELLTTIEAATFCKVSPRTLERWIASGLLPVVRVGKVRRIRASDLRTLLTPH